MPRDLGDAEAKDLTGHLPGEREDLVSGLARYLQKSGQLRVADEERGNGRHDTEVPISAKAAESLRAEASGAFLEQTLDAEQEAEILIEPMLSPTPLEETGELSVADVQATLMPELAGREPEPADEETDTAPPRRQRGLPTMKPEAEDLLLSGDTGLLEMQTGALPDRSDSEDIIDDDETSEDDRATAKVLPARGNPYRLSVPIVRDTVNFYNQTQALTSRAPDDNPRRDKLPTISVNEVSQPAHLGLEPVDEEFAEGDEGRGNETDRFDDAVRRAPTWAEKQKDTQKFLVAEVADSSAGESTAAELEMAQRGRPATGAADAGFETVGDITASDMEAARKAPLPKPSDVSADFELLPEETASQRMMPELTGSESAGFNSAFEDELPAVEAEQQPSQEDGPVRITERVTKPPAPQPQPADAEAVPRVTDALTRRIRQERDETLRLIQQAEEVAARLRAASERTYAAPEAAKPKTAPKHAAQLSTPKPAVPEPARAAVAPTASQARSLRSRRVDSHRTTRRRPVVPPDDLVERIESKLSSRAYSVDASVFAASSRVAAPSGGYFATHDVDELVAASAVLRDSIEAEWEDSGRDEPPDDPPPEPPRRLSDRLVEIRDVLDSRPPRYLVEERSVRTAPVVEVPAPDGNQERLWKTIVGILLLIVGLGAAFSYGLFYFLQSR